jgi:hypothetical protein
MATTKSGVVMPRLSPGTAKRGQSEVSRRLKMGSE